MYGYKSSVNLTHVWIKFISSTHEIIVKEIRYINWIVSIIITILLFTNKKILYFYNFILWVIMTSSLLLCLLSRSVFLIRMCFYSHLIHMAAIIWSILRGGVSRNMVGVCLSRRGYLPIGLMDLGRRSHGLRAYFYNSPHFNLPEMCLLSLSGRLPYFWYGGPIQWWGLGPNRAPPPSPFIFPQLQHLYSP